jgi:surface protein
MVLTVDVPSSTPYGTRVIRLPANGTCNCVINWGDGTTTSRVGTFSPLGDSVSKTYASTGTYTITITGTMTNYGDPFMVQTWLKSVTSWGTTGLTGLFGGFYGANQLTSLPSNSPPSTITNMSDTFAACTVFNQDISNWNVGNVTTMNAMFRDASSFNQNISTWSVGNVTNMNSMFQSATAFNQNLSSWITGLTSQPSSFSSSANATFANNANLRKPFLSNGTTRITT